MGLQSIQSGYLVRSSVILLLCVLDCCLNAVGDHPSPGMEPFTPYIVIGVQVAVQVINLLLVFMLFSGTYLFQVGLVGVQVREFRGLLLGALAYLPVYITYAAYKISLISSSTGVDGVWDVPGFIFLSIAQKLASLLYYLVMLAICSRMGEVMWYDRTPWVQKFSSGSSSSSAASSLA